MLPPHPINFITNGFTILGFAFTFAVVASFWWTHSAIFRHFFVANRVMIVLNFIALGLIVLQVFALQMLLHFGGNRPDEIAAARIYFGIFALTQLTLATLSAVGIHYRREALSPQLRQSGILRTTRVGCRAAGIAVGVAIAGVNAGFLTVTADAKENVAIPMQIVFGLLAGLLAGRIAAGYLTRRWRAGPRIPE